MVRGLSVHGHRNRAPSAIRLSLASHGQLEVCQWLGLVATEY